MDMCKHPAGPPRIGAADRAGPSRSRGRAGETTAVSRGRRARSRPLRRRLMPDKSATALTAEYPRVAGRRIISRPDGRTGLTAVRGLGSCCSWPVAAPPAPVAFCPCQPKTNGAVGNRRSRKRDGERAAEVERDGKDVAGPTDVTADVTTAVAVNLLTTPLLNVTASSIKLLLYAALMTGCNYFNSPKSDQFTRIRAASER